MITPLDGGLLPVGVRTRFIPNVNGLTMYVPEAEPDAPGRSCVLLHRLPELAYSWCKVMPALAQAGYYVIVPDPRDYGRTTGWDPAYDGNLALFRIFNIVRDIVGLVAAIGRTSVTAVVGHDLGSPAAPGVRCCGRTSSAVSR